MSKRAEVGVWGEEHGGRRTKEGGNNIEGVVRTEDGALERRGGEGVGVKSPGRARRRRVGGRQ